MGSEGDDDAGRLNADPDNDDDAAPSPTTAPAGRFASPARLSLPLALSGLVSMVKFCLLWNFRPPAAAASPLFS